MKALVDPTNALGRGLGAIRDQFQVPYAFPDAVLAAAASAATRAATAHVDRTDLPFVTLDPAQSTDLDQAFAIDRSGGDLLLHYAIADIAWFVDDGDVIDAEAWQRGTTQYLPDGKAGLYPPVLSEGVASLLPGGPRLAVIFTVRLAPDGRVRLDGAERALIRSTAKLAYDSVRSVDLPADFGEFARRMRVAEGRRGAVRVDPPEQEVATLGDGRYDLLFRVRLASEDDNAALSLAANLAIADALAAHRTGLFRVMQAPDEKAVGRLRHTAQAFGIAWPENETLAQFELGLDAGHPRQAALMLAIRRAGTGASYEPYKAGVVPWHSAVAATYAHATAPLRRLADRYVVRATLAIANGQPVPDVVSEAFHKLPAIMAQADARSAKIDRAVVDLAEAVMLSGREGEIFSAVVTDVDERGVRLQLCDLPVIARMRGNGFAPGDGLRVKLLSADPAQLPLMFEPAA